jgi:hypothetical protein
MNRDLGIGHTSLRRYLLILNIYLLCIGSGTSQVRINEILTVNATFNYDPQYFNFPSWVELHNTGSTILSIGGYYLTDNKTVKNKWAIPYGTTIGANSYLIIWCDNQNSGLHSNFTIDSDGETIYLYNTALILQDSIRLPKQYSNISYGRVSNGSSYNYFLTPTFAAANGASDILGLILPPTFSLPSGRYNSAITLSLSSALPGIQIRYTTDGTEPTQQSTLYSSGIVISQTCVIKAKIFTSYSLPSETVTRTYFINEHAFTLPTVSVSMNPSFLWDNTIGMHVTGTNGITGNCTDQPQNYNRDWGRYCVVELFDSLGNSQFKKDFETKIYGACSRYYFQQKSLAFYTRSKYGKSHLEHRLFKSKNIDKFDQFILRNSGNDFNITMFRDALMQALIMNKLDMELQAYQPAAVYLNGAYWGIMNIREKLGKDYIEHNAKVDKDSIDFLEKNAEVIDGGNTAYVNFVNQLGTRNLSTKETFDYINANMDVDNYIHYYITQIYYGNTDWPGNNIKFWKPKKQGGKWRWILFDTDFGFELLPQYSTSTHATLNFVTDSTTTVGWPNPQWSTLLFRRLIKNPYFRERFIQTFIASINYVFKPARVNAFIDSISSLIAPEMVYHKQKWGGTLTDWNTEVQKLKTFAAERYNFMPGHINSFFHISQQIANLRVSVNPANSGAAVLNNMKVTETDTLWLYHNMGYNIAAHPADGYKFKQWNIRNVASSTETLINKGDTWKYYDKGTNLNTAWIEETYNDSSWLAGTAQLGYGDGDESTIVSYGTDAANKYITTYFRKSINIGDTANIKKATINLLCDDGAVIYINGAEAGRFNMPTGTINYNTLATTYATEDVYVLLPIDYKLFKPGTNAIAVEIHQNSVSSSDLSFDMNITVKKVLPGITEYTSTSPNITDTVYSDLSYNAEFEPITPITNVYINEIAAKNTTYPDNYGNTDDWFELYNANNDTIDLVGLFLTDNFKRPDKFKVWKNNSNNTKIPPHSFTIFWADEEEHQGNKHCSFKLSGDGERLGLFQIVGTDTFAIDTVSYMSQMEFFTYGRYPDGNINLVFMNNVTPSSNNIYSPLQIPDHTVISENALIYPNPVRSGLNVYITEAGSNISYIIYNYLGKAVLQGTLKNTEIDCSSLNKGVYIITINADGKRWSKKFIKE